jgi:hypothetical protein
MFKKPGQSAVSYSDFNSDPEFRKIVFSEEYVDDQTNSYGDQVRQKVKHEAATVWKTSEENSTKLGGSGLHFLLNGRKNLWKLLRYSNKTVLFTFCASGWKERDTSK